MAAKFLCAVAAALIALTLSSGQAHAVCFKALNETNVTLRGRVHDRGQWREWVTMSPGYWACFASSVKRTEHAVEIDYWTGRGWRELYRGSHGSRVFTRVIHFTAGGGHRVAMTWWDEPPGCRAMPPSSTHPSTCLRPSGSWGRLLFNLVIKVVPYLVK